MAGDDQFRSAMPHAAGDGVDQGFDGAAWYAEDVFDADLLKVVDDQIAAFEWGFSRECVAGCCGYFAVPRAHMSFPRKDAPPRA